MEKESFEVVNNDASAENIVNEKMPTEANETPTETRETPAETVAAIFEIMKTWKKIPDSYLSQEDRRALELTDSNEARRLKHNKFGVNYFNTLITELHRLLLINGYLKDDDSEIKKAYNKINNFADTVRAVPLIQESQIDEFEAMVIKVINLVPNK